MQKKSWSESQQATLMSYYSFYDFSANIDFFLINNVQKYVYFIKSPVRK